MGMSTHVVGYQPRDEEWEEKAVAYKACKRAGVPIPKELVDYFDEEGPDAPGREVRLGNAVKRWDDGNSASGYEVDLSKLPVGVKILRFYNAW